MNEESENLPELGTHDLDARASDAIRRRAQARLATERRLLAHPLTARWTRAYDRAIEPALVLTACVVYLVWALERTLDLMR